MSTLKLKGSTSGYVELTAPATAGDNTITLPTTAGTVAVKDASNNVEVGTGVTIGSPSSNTFTVSTNGSERVRVDSSGNVGVKTSAPVFDLDVYSSGQVIAGVRSGGTNASIHLQTASTGYGTGNGLYLGLSGGSNYIWTYENEPILFGTNNTERARILAAGGLTFNGDTAAANALDDYEEGSWTPLPVGLSNTPTWDNQKGRYTKIGRLVHLKGFLQVGATAPTFTSTSAVFTIGTLPFAPDNNNVGYQYAAGSFYAQSFRWLGAGYNQNNLTAGQVTPVINQTSGVWGVAFMISESNNARSLVVNNAENGSSFIIEFEITYSTGT